MFPALPPQSLEADAKLVGQQGKGEETSNNVVGQHSEGEERSHYGRTTLERRGGKPLATHSGLGSPNSNDQVPRVILRAWVPC